MGDFDRYLDYASNQPMRDGEEICLFLNASSREKGKWLFPDPSTKMICTCSVCGGYGNAFGKDKFCRNCGAEMEGE